MWGRIVGLLLGLAFARLPGAILGFVVGWWFDRALARDFRGAGFGKHWHRLDEAGREQLFFHTSFAVMGHLAKAKGRVREEDIHAASALMDRLHLSGEKRRAAQEAFREGKAAGYPLEASVQALREGLAGQQDLLQLFMEIQVALALADGKLLVAERRVLERVRKSLGLPERLLDALIRMAKAGQAFTQAPEQSRYARLGQAYALLGLEPDADMQAVRRAYKKAMAEHHPDKLMAKGLPAEMQELAKERAQAIQAAYQQIKTQRSA
ncbi:co-chaperone DjlA [Gallaecimonas xiamenensis]|uniref:Co-chaperone protein DjlA n=1 Tax=Gallaecimonas xiamenensis 3-C-1 TaxID=745411 RepID=K2JKA8_9GAMM|nr:co-chaperone DjlA [Gallaecimonas xiamenensis]EKE75733.1 Dna-J like membrane chaperone protein [Gallaecimonas xiamenensis 3-C-1]